MANPMYGQNKSDNLLDEIRANQASLPVSVVSDRVSITITAAANTDGTLAQPAGTWLSDLIIVPHDTITTAGASGDDLDFSFGTSAGGTRLLGGAAKALLDDGGAAVSLAAPVYMIDRGAGKGANAHVGSGIATSEASAVQATLYSAAARTLHARITPLANNLATAATTVTYLVQFLHMGTTPDQ